MLPPHTASFVNGKPIESDTCFTCENPATQETICELSSANGSIVDLAVKSAGIAYEETWGKYSIGKRQKVLENLAAMIRENKDELIKLESTENGVPITIVEKFSVAALEKNISHFASWIDKITSDVIPVTSATGFDFTLKEPFGVAAIITAYNTPSLFLGSKAGAALAAGNSVVIKPSPLASFPALKFAQLAKEAGLPDGTVNVILGDHKVGSDLISNKSVDIISFTGSAFAGKQVANAANKYLTPTILELGGKSPNLIFPDANLDSAAFQSAIGAFALTGQACVAGSRIYVHEEIYDQLVDKLIAMTKLLKVGDPAEKQTVLGPLITQSHLNKVTSTVYDAVQKGGNIVLGGDRPTSELPLGYFFNPTIITGLKESDRILKDEIFGPIVAVQKFRDEDEAVRLANDIKYGLGAAVWTKDISRALRISRQLRAGMIWINAYGVVPHTAPFGGFKQSGHGKEGGKYGIEMYLQSKNIYVDAN